MVNERFRRAMLRAGHDIDSLAAALQVSSKSVSRWLAATSVPYPKTRYRLAALLGEDESYLWPEVADRSTLVDDELLVNTHVYGLLAAYTPCLHIRRIDGQFFNTYLESFERVWASARPLD